MLGSFNFPMRLRILNRVLRLWGCSYPTYDNKDLCKDCGEDSGVQFLAGLNPNFEYARVHLLDRTPFPTLEEAHAYCISDKSHRSPMPPIFKIPSESSAMAVRYAYPALPSVPSQTSHTSSPSLSPLPVVSGNSRPPRKKCDYCSKWGHLKTTCHALHDRRARYQPHPSQSLAHLSADSSTPDSLAFSTLSQD
ncbi:hypothetical protein GIB67_028085 [Kingdonia uniflora]|uniref:Uncharacterized protein n=1 Tax=Kingdonia uniflora TaxID=39325 RepID=A0A7J7MBA6_9MAGN|nr:hypothetical protein GIB67_028085 [Kingdonia uniflora]